MFREKCNSVGKIFKGDISIIFKNVQNNVQNNVQEIFSKKCLKNVQENVQKIFEKCSGKNTSV